MAILKVRVNPRDPEEFIVVGSSADNFRNHTWPEFELEIPVPDRVYTDGDIVQVSKIRYIRLEGYWYQVSSAAEHFIRYGAFEHPTKVVRRLNAGIFGEEVDFIGSVYNFGEK